MPIPLTKPGRRYVLQVIVTKHVNATRSDINNGYRARTTLTQTVWYHRGVAEQADLLMQAMITYFGDMVSFFDEIAHALLAILAKRINIPDIIHPYSHSPPLLCRLPRECVHYIGRVFVVVNGQVVSLTSD